MKFDLIDASLSESMHVQPSRDQSGELLVISKILYAAAVRTEPNLTCLRWPYNLEQRTSTAGKLGEVHSCMSFPHFIISTANVFKTQRSLSLNHDELRPL